MADTKEKQAEATSTARRSKRVRKATATFTIESKEVKNKVYIPGNGTQLGDIENIKTLIHRANNDDLKILHKVLYGRPGKQTIRKRTIRAFKGYLESEVGGYKNRIGKLSTKDLKYCFSVLDLKKGGDKESNAADLLEFLKSPNVESTAKSKTLSLSTKRKRKSQAKGKSKKSKTGAKRPLSGYMLYIQSIRKEVTKENPGLKMVEITKILGEKWRALSPGQQQKWKDKSKTAASKTTKKKSKPTKKKSTADEESTDSDDDDEPLGAPESIEEKLKVAIKKILKEENLQELTVRKIKDILRKDFGEAVDENKKFIKTFVKEQF
mmetsp:Transcript_1696/g.3944  ORF Transcript_1696/g.3944 Transcript_1696/m.3944 type:complete len:323 (+) Transcript_1696:55-1023(+)